MSDARQPERPVILLSCVQTLSQSAPPSGDQLCQQMTREMIQALAQTAAGPQIIRRVAPGQDQPRRPGDLGVTLHLEDRAAGPLQGYVAWRQTGGAEQTGPVHQLAGHPPSQQEYASFARAMIQATPGLSKALRAPL